MRSSVLKSQSLKQDRTCDAIAALSCILSAYSCSLAGTATEINKRANIQTIDSVEQAKLAWNIHRN
jgi:hypothetical protein